MRCPRCKKLRDILAFEQMETNEEFEEETVPCYKCPNCRWIFAPAENAIAGLIELAREVVSSR